MVQVPVSIGELIDKITILEIKLRRIDNEEKLHNIRRELRALEQVERDASLVEGADALKTRLREVNERLWDIEDAIRRHEKEGDFGEAFVELARSVYIENDQRSRIKRELNLLTGSELVEEKSYEEYR